MNKIGLKIVSSITLLTMIGYTLPVFAYEKEETVYTKLDNTGKNYKTIVSTYIKNTDNEELIEDISDLLNIENTSGDETYTQDGDKFIWNANKNDIYYQGETQKELPIECEVKYELDGEEISPDEIIGKNGSVKVTLQYTNKEERIINVNGKNVKMYVPFVIVAGTIINNENNKNIEVSSGKVVNDGTKTVVIGMAMPGLQESLGVSKDEIEIPNNIEITMDAKNFEMGSIVSYVTPKVLDKNDLKIFDKLNNIYSQVNQLQDASKQLVDGTKELNEGAHELSKGLNSKISIYESARQKYSNREEIRKALIKTVNDQMPSVLPAIEEQVEIEAKNVINEHKDELKKAATETSIKYIKLAAEQKIAEIDDSIGKISSETSQEIASQARAIKEAIKTAKKIENPEMTDAELEEYANNQIESFTKSISTKITEKVKQKINENPVLDNYIKQAEKELQETINTILENTATELSEVYTEQISTEIAQNLIQKELNGELSETELDKVINKYYSQINSKLKDVDAEINTLKSGLNQLTNGTEQLAYGMNKFDEEGIRKICNLVNGDVKDVATRAEKLIDLSKDYNNFTMINEGNEGTVKFIMIIDSLKERTDSEQDKQEAVLNTNNLTEKDDK